jgi:hypothetical protein
MMTADLALALLINRTSAFYDANRPVYMTYLEHTRVTAPTLGRAQSIDRTIAVRAADNFAVMQDLPNGEQRTGQAFPIVADFDPFSSFSFGYFANLKRVDITIQRGKPLVFPIPEEDPSVNVVVPYISFWDVKFAPDSSATALHFSIEPTPRFPSGLYPSDVVEDSSTQLPSHIEIRAVEGDEEFSLDYKVIGGHWLIVHGTFSQTEKVAFMTFKVVADVTFSNIAFPSEPPDPRLAGTPTPSPAPT